MKSELRETDEKCANIVSEFLDNVFYSTHTQKFERIDTLKEQIQGVDIKFKFKNKAYICDEKAAIRYVNKTLKTFSFELNFTNQGDKLADGWLLDEKKINNSFLLVWIDKAKKDIIENKSDIEICEIALIKRRSIIDYLKDRGWDKEKLAIKSKRIRENENEDLGNIYKNGLKFTYSKQLVEQPINVLIPREELIKMSVFSKVFTNNDLKE